jgi:superfamily I DNA/RNA helicase
LLKNSPYNLKRIPKKILCRESQAAPESITARESTDKCVKTINADRPLPTNATELHLVRCNYQKYGVAMKLAEEGKPFVGNKALGWSEDDVRLFNIIRSYRTGTSLSGVAYKALLEVFPISYFNTRLSKSTLIEQVSSPTFHAILETGDGLISEKLDGVLKSKYPLSWLGEDKKLFQRKIMGALQKFPGHMTLDDARNRRLMTIHAAKGGEAQAAFLHTAIPPVVNKALMIPGAESQAEARVWYVGATRPKEMLYIVQDMGINYKIPEVSTC